MIKWNDFFLINMNLSPPKIIKILYNRLLLLKLPMVLHHLLILQHELQPCIYLNHLYINNFPIFKLHCFSNLLDKILKLL